MQARIPFYGFELRTINYISFFSVRSTKNDIILFFSRFALFPLNVFHSIKISTDQCSQIISLNVLIFMNREKTDAFFLNASAS